MRVKTGPSPKRVLIHLNTPFSGQKELRRTTLSLLPVQAEQSLYGSEPPEFLTVSITEPIRG